MPPASDSFVLQDHGQVDLQPAGRRREQGVETLSVPWTRWVGTPRSGQPPTQRGTSPTLEKTEEEQGIELPTRWKGPAAGRLVAGWLGGLLAGWLAGLLFRILHQNRTQQSIWDKKQKLYLRLISNPPQQARETTQTTSCQTYKVYRLICKLCRN